MEERFDTQHLAKPLVYIAGPYAHPDPVENTHRTLKFADELIEDGVVTPFVPHLTLLWHMVTPRPAAFWYSYDFAVLTRCDAVLRLVGASTGADEEVALAEDRSIPVFTGRDELYEWASEWRA